MSNTLELPLHLLSARTDTYRIYVSNLCNARMGARIKKRMHIRFALYGEFISLEIPLTTRLRYAHGVVINFTIKQLTIFWAKLEKREWRQCGRVAEKY